MSKESSVFFPEAMRYVELVVPHESTYHLIRGLSQVDLIHLVDFNVEFHAHEKRYTEDYMQCEDAERCLRFIQAQLERYNLLPEKPDLLQFEQEAEHSGMSHRQLLPTIEDVDAQLHQRIQSTQQLEAQRKQLSLCKDALSFYRPLLRERNIFSGETSERDGSTLEMELLGPRNFLFSITGVIEATKLRRLFVAMYRASRGNILMNQGSKVGGSDGYFTVWFQTQLLGKKLTQIASSYGATVFEFPVEDSALDQKELELENELRDVENVLNQSYTDNRSFLVEIQEKFWFWRLFFAREAMIFMYMDYADFTQVDDCAVYRGWIPLRRMDELEPLLEDASNDSGSARKITYEVRENNGESPPTWIQTNTFTEPFQQLNDAYGYAEYSEVNGGAFYAMYPFLFGIMFGDIGHSFFYLLMAIALIVAYPKLKGGGELFQTVLGFRYFLLVMALCGIYNGFLYNECFGLPIDIFGSHYAEHEVNGTHVWLRTDNGTYPFGLDPVWIFKDNELIFTNSLKMKISVVMGILQMVFGMFLQLIKQVRRRAWIELALGWVPQMMYLCSFFLYMVAIVIYKWCIGKEKGEVSLIQVLISMLLSPTDIPAELQLFEHQMVVQNVVALCFVLSIPLMLIVKPIVEMCVHGVGNGILETFVITLIDVIEFTLSALSHTASYLRLWALSLAHSQLSHVLYEQLFVMTLELGAPFLVIGFAAWAVGSVLILLGMECFSSLLHAIRLMWVEFSSKFYSGTGYEFKPVSFEREFKLIPARITESE